MTQRSNEDMAREATLGRLLAAAREAGWSEDSGDSLRRTFPRQLFGAEPGETSAEDLVLSRPATQAASGATVRHGCRIWVSDAGRRAVAYCEMAW
jgi:hypothetical protein